MDTRIVAPSFQSVQFLNPDTKTPMIQSGGPSNSNLFNRYFNTLSNDVLNMNTRLSELALKSTRIANISTSSGTGLTALLSGLVSSIDAIATGSEVYVDLFSDYGVNTGTITSNHNKVYGQLTLPEVSSKNLLVNTDVNNDKYLLSDVKISYAYSASTTVPSPELFINDVSALYTLTNDQSWVVDSSSNNYIWVKLQAPMNYLSLYPNVLEVWPLPMGITDLYRVYVRKAGSLATGTLDSIDISYLPFYDVPSLSAKNVGPFKLHLNNEPLTEIILGFKLNSVASFGIQQINLLHKEYAVSSVVTVGDPFSRVLTGTPTVRGKDPSSLSLLSIVPTGSEYQLTLTTNSSSLTPVVTGFILPV
jgi:hypothetical protein